MVAGVQEGTWPDVRRRGSLLEADRLGRRAVDRGRRRREPVAEERRLFYVACTRARSPAGRHRGAGTEGEGDQPSRFLAELGVPVADPPRAARAGRCPSPPWSASCARSASTRRLRPALREQAADRLARLARGHRRRTAVRWPPAADPDRWWGLRPLSSAARPGACRRSSRCSCPAASWPACWPARGSGSSPGRRAPSRSRSTAASFGSVIHVLAEHGAAHRRRSGRADRAPGRGLAPARLRRQLAVGGRAGRGRGRPGTLRQLAAGPDRLGAARHRGRVLLQVDLGGERVQLIGTADRVERDPDGRLRIVDFKTGRTPPAGGRRRPARPARGLPAGRGRRARSPQSPGPEPGQAGRSWSTCGCPTDRRGYPKVFTQASHRRHAASRSVRRARADDDAARPGCTSGWPTRRRWCGPSGTRPG